MAPVHLGPHHRLTAVQSGRQWFPGLDCPRLFNLRCRRSPIRGQQVRADQGLGLVSMPLSGNVQ